MPNAAEIFAAHAANASLPTFPDHAIEQAKIFILDTLGVGVAGSSAFGTSELLHPAGLWGSGNEVSVWGRRDRCPATAAAFLNAFAVHCQEYDCVCEPAVLHPMVTLLPAALAFAERQGGISGSDLLAAVVVGWTYPPASALPLHRGCVFFALPQPAGSAPPRRLGA